MKRGRPPHEFDRMDLTVLARETHLKLLERDRAKKGTVKRQTLTNELQCLRKKIAYWHNKLEGN